MKKPLLLGIGVVIVVVVALFLWYKPAVAPTGSPSPSPTSSVSPTPQANIIILSPKVGDIVSNPIHVTGKARVFEATFAYRLRDANGKILAEGNGMTTGPSVPDYGNFDFKIQVPAGATKKMTVEVFEFSAKDGEVVNLASVAVELATLETMKVDAYFSNDKLDPAATCTKVFAVKRDVIKTQEVGFVALAEMLRGPFASEKNYRTNISKGTQIKSLVIRDGTAYADFNYALESNGGGSCHVQAVKAQIESTLKQFPTVKKVVISVEGRTDGILQP